MPTILGHDVMISIVEKDVGPLEGKTQAFITGPLTNHLGFPNNRGKALYADSRVEAVLRVEAYLKAGGGGAGDEAARHVSETHIGGGKQSSGGSSGGDMTAGALATFANERESAAEQLEPIRCSQGPSISDQDYSADEQELLSKAVDAAEASFVTPAVANTSASLAATSPTSVAPTKYPKGKIVCTILGHDVTIAMVQKKGGPFEGKTQAFIIGPLTNNRGKTLFADSRDEVFLRVEAYLKAGGGGGGERQPPPPRGQVLN